jgi:four helix bundle protein
MQDNKKTIAKPTTKSIENLRIYQASRALEDTTYELVQKLPSEEFYKLGDELRRSSAAISHYIAEAHKRYSYGFKLEALHLARAEAEALQKHLVAHAEQGYGKTDQLQAECVAVIKQSWGLIKYFKQRQTERQASAQVQASDEMVAARAS